MISLAEALYIAFLKQETYNSANFICSNNSDRSDVQIDGFFNLQQMANELNDIIRSDNEICFGSSV
jgi:hypothetical protein